jgi:hypothetical protein
MSYRQKIKWLVYMTFEYFVAVDCIFGIKNLQIDPFLILYEIIIKVVRG